MITEAIKLIEEYNEIHNITETRQNIFYRTLKYAQEYDEVIKDVETLAALVIYAPEDEVLEAELLEMKNSLYPDAPAFEISIEEIELAQRF